MNLDVTLDQIKALDAVARLGSLTEAAKSLRKGHSALIYLLKQLELQTGLALLDRKSYRVGLTPVGERFLTESRKLLVAEQGLMNCVSTLRSDWEPRLVIVYDGIFPNDRVLQAIWKVKKSGCPTPISAYSGFLRGVEQEFIQKNADFMISILPADPLNQLLSQQKLSSISSYLVAHRSHPLLQSSKKSLKKTSSDELSQHLLITVRGSDPHLSLSTSELETGSSIHVSDFYSKKEAILSGYGYGWLPEFLIQNELKNGTLKRIHSELKTQHSMTPVLYWKASSKLGRAAQMFLKQIREYK